jgi:hypothetical protein
MGTDISIATNEWFYIWLSYGVMWIGFTVYFFRMRARRVAALRALTEKTK